MIKKMTKYTLVLFHRDVEGFLSGLQDLGVVDITRSKRSVDTVSKEKFDEIEKCRRLASKLESVHNNIIEEFENGKKPMPHHPRLILTVILSLPQPAIKRL